MTQQASIKIYTLKEYLEKEVLLSGSFSWLRVFQKIRKKRECNFIFWYRVSYVLQRKKHRFARRRANKINNRIKFKFCCDVSSKSCIDIGFQIGH